MGYFKVPIVFKALKIILFFVFAGGLLSTAQSYPSLSASNNAAGASGSAGAGHGSQSLGPALTMSVTSTSSDSEQVFDVIIYCFTLLEPYIFFFQLVFTLICVWSILI